MKVEKNASRGRGRKEKSDKKSKGTAEERTPEWFWPGAYLGASSASPQPVSASSRRRPYRRRTGSPAPASLEPPPQRWAVEPSSFLLPNRKQGKDSKIPPRTQPMYSEAQTTSSHTLKRKTWDRLRISDSSAHKRNPPPVRAPPPYSLGHSLGPSTPVMGERQRMREQKENFLNWMFSSSFSPINNQKISSLSAHIRGKSGKEETLETVVSSGVRQRIAHTSAEDSLLVCRLRSSSSSSWQWQVYHFNSPFCPSHPGGGMDSVAFTQQLPSVFAMRIWTKPVSPNKKKLNQARSFETSLNFILQIRRKFTIRKLLSFNQPIFKLRFKQEKGMNFSFFERKWIPFHDKNVFLMTKSEVYRGRLLLLLLLGWVCHTKSRCAFNRLGPSRFWLHGIRHVTVHQHSMTRNKYRLADHIAVNGSFIVISKSHTLGRKEFSTRQTGHVDHHIRIN